jgi:chemotaxis receptor (MCP) glutamine deamidase CheD|tara:strand:- start:8571 stop:8777 length:207 start_codon:yes stop_codon:yes gene_type:complete
MNSVRVREGHYETANDPDILYSGGLGTCVAVGAIYEGQGYMSHDPVNSDTGNGSTNGTTILRPTSCKR